MNVKQEDVSTWIEKLRNSRDLVLGIDHGTHAWTYVLIHQIKKEILAWGSYTLDFPQQEKDKKNSNSFLKELAKSLPVHRIKSININIQGPAVISGRFQVPVVEKGDYTDLIRTALRAQLPFALDEAVYFAQPYGKVKVSEEAQSSPLERMGFNFVAIERKSLSSILDPVAEAFGIIPGMTIQGYALESLVDCLGLCPKGETIACINVGRSLTNISVFKDGKMVFERVMSLAGQDITRSILILYREEGPNAAMLDLDSAEKLKKASYIPLLSNMMEIPTETTGAPLPPEGKMSELQNHKVFQSIQGVLAAWIQDVKLSFNYLSDHYEASSETIKKIYMLGGSANLKNFPQYVEQQLGIKTELLTLSDSVSLSFAPEKDARAFKETFHQYAPALAYSLKAENYATLTPPEFRKAPYVKFILPSIRVAYVFIAACMVIWYLFLAFQTGLLKERQKILQVHRQFLTLIEAPYAEMLEWQKMVNGIDVKNHKTSTLLKVLSQKAPPSALFSKLQMNREDDGLNIEGFLVGDPKKRAVTVAAFSEGLKNSGYFKKIEVPQMDAVVNDPNLGTFKMDGKITPLFREETEA